MTTGRACLAALLVTAVVGASACGPLRLDSTPQIRGTIVTADAESVNVRHKTGGIYRVALTRDTRIIQNHRPTERPLCPGLRTTVRLVDRAPFTASSVTVWGGRCK